MQDKSERGFQSKGWFMKQGCPVVKLTGLVTEEMASALLCRHSVCLTWCRERPSLHHGDRLLPHGNGGSQAVLRTCSQHLVGHRHLYVCCQ